MKAPFGVATERFKNIGFHPGLDKCGALKKQVTTAGPGSYDPRPIQSRSRNISWKRKLELEEFSKFLGYRNGQILRSREFFKTHGGPGTYELSDFEVKEEKDKRRQNVGFGTTARDMKYYSTQAPPPNTYFKKSLDVLKPPHKTFSKVPTFEFDGVQERFKPTEPNYHLPCNLYKTDVPNMADIIDKVVSARGPYDLFTGPRDETTIKNYLAPPKHKNPDYYYIKPTDRDILLNHPSKKNCGVFLHANRFPKKPTARHMLTDISLCYKDPNAPGPASYDLKLHCLERKKPGKYPFGQSTLFARPPKEWKISPGPGRYNAKAPRCFNVKKPSYVFLSSGTRGFFTKKEDYSLIGDTS